MPKYRSGKINEAALVSTQACIITRQKLKFFEIPVFEFCIFTFLNPNARKKNVMSSMN